jgi:polyribonucleotide nucleotidyltransferase
MEEAVNKVEMIGKEAEVGEIYEGEVKTIMPYGAFIEILPGKDGLLHISEIDKKRTRKVEDVMNVGDTVKVKVIGKDGNKIKLSRKVLL